MKPALASWSVLVSAALATGVVALRSSGDAQSPPTAQPAAAGTVSGVASVSGAGPLRRARVTLRGSGLSAAVVTADTDTEGRFTAAAVPPGTYRVVGEKPGFVPFGPSPAIDVAANQTVAVALAMQRGSAIEGRLVNAEGEPVSGLTVSAVRLGFGIYGKKPIAAQQAVTDDLGRYRLHSLRAGEYYVQAEPDPLRLASARNVTAGAPQPVRTYYSGAAIAGTAQLNDARAVSVDAGQDVGGVDFGVASAAPTMVRARVTMASGDKPDKFGIRIQRVGAPAGEVACFLGQPPNENTLTCSNVPPGEFWFLATARSAPDAPIEFAATRVSTAGMAVPDIVLTTGPGVVVNGRVETADHSPLPPGLQIAAFETEYEFPAAQSPAAGTTATPPVNVAADGTFTFPSVAGARLLRAEHLPETWALASVRVVDTDISDTPVKFAPNVPAMRVMVTSHTGAVTGTVQLATELPAFGTRVVVFSDDARRWGARSRFIKTAEIDRDGHYLLRGLLPGAYLVAFVDALEDGAWEDPDVLARLRPTALPATVADGQTATVNWKWK